MSEPNFTEEATKLVTLFAVPDELEDKAVELLAAVLRGFWLKGQYFALTGEVGEFNRLFPVKEEV